MPQYTSTTSSVLSAPASNTCNGYLIQWISGDRVYFNAKGEDATTGDMFVDTNTKGVILPGARSEGVSIISDTAESGVVNINEI